MRVRPHTGRAYERAAKSATHRGLGVAGREAEDPAASLLKVSDPLRRLSLDEDLHRQQEDVS
jgi:hypothetical protein